MTLRFIDLYCGAGLLSAGLQRAGLVPVLGVDLDPVALSSYADNFPDALVWSKDVREIGSLPRADVIVGGPPCQPFSKANRSRSSSPDLSHIDAFVRLATSSKARWVLMEEVPDVRDHLEGVFPRMELIDCSSMGSRNHRPRLFAGDFPDPIPGRSPVEDPAPTVMASDSSTPIDVMQDLQGVPGWMVFHGTDEEVRRQVGNGVPIPVGEAFGRGMLRSDRGRSSGNHEPWHWTTALFHREQGGKRSYLSASHTGFRYCPTCEACVEIGTP